MSTHSNKLYRLRIAVRELVSYTMRSGNLDLTGFGMTNPVDAINAHTMIQDARPREYTKEVLIRHTLKGEDFELDITGRIDGVYEYPDQVIIDEIKTTRKALPDEVEQEDGQHWAQAKCYAYMYADRKDLEAVTVQLTYYDIENESRQEIRRTYTRKELQEFFKELAARYLIWARMIVTWKRASRASMKQLTFPFSSYRLGQETMLQETEAIIEQQGQLLVQAPTGIGKTLAVLIPTIKALSRGTASQFFYLTARTTGRQAAETTLELLREKGLKLKSLSLTAKDKVCLNTRKACSPVECEYARGHFDRLNAALNDAFSYDNLTRDTVIELAKKHTVCPFEFSLDLSLWVECVICDYNYVFDPGVYLRRFFDEGLTTPVILVDEAHNLVDRAREMYSAELTRRQINDVRKEIKDSLKKLHGILGKVNSWFVKQRTICEEAQAPIAEREPPIELLTLLKRFTKQAEEWLVLNKPAPFRQGLTELYFEVRKFMRTAGRFNANYATCYHHAGRDLQVKLFCIDPARFLRETLEKCHSTIFFSGTLSPMHYFIESLGCDEKAATLTLPSPFDRNNLCVIIVTAVSTLYKHRLRTRSSVARIINSFVEAKQGNYLLFFPSYQYMKMVHEVFRPGLPDIVTILQSSGMSEQERERFIQKFAGAPKKHLAGFAVLGGAFSESIDLVGDRLTGAVIVGVGMPGISLEQELIRNYFDEVNERGYEFAYQYPGMVKVLQAAGRVIRSETDRGSILLIDPRFSKEPYYSLLPREWQVRKSDCISDVRSLLLDFWSGCPAEVQEQRVQGNELE